MDFLEKNKRRFLKELYEIISIPSVSAQREHKGDIKKAAAWVKSSLKEIGSKTRIMPTKGNPVVFGEIAGKSDFTVLFYGHYDVQPEGDVKEWDSEPFTPTLRKGRVYARGGSDNKFQFFSHIKACETLLKERGELPVSVKFIIEGEEEVGSANLKKFVSDKRRLLKSDVVYISDSPTYTEKIPNISLGVRGLLYAQLDVQGPKQELHSGIHGGTIDNPNEVICQLVSSLKLKVGNEEKILIPSFYSDVVPIAKNERKYLASLKFDERAYGKELGVKRFVGEKGYSILEKRTARPTLEIHGIHGGYTKEGAKTSIPTKAFAKISFRLVPNQDPEKIFKNLKSHINHLGYPNVEITRLSGERAYTIPIDHPFVKVASIAAKKAWKTDPRYIREGGTIPIYFFPDYLGAENLLVGYGSPRDNLHGPNESFILDSFWKGIRTSAYAMEEFSKITFSPTTAKHPS